MNMTDQEKMDFILKYHQDEKLLSEASNDDKALYKQYIEEGCAKEWPIAIEAKAYECYGGSELYDCDWFTSRDCLLKLISIQGDENPFIYNTLGYIYYYGRCNDGVPEYEKAFMYFSVGAAHGIFESRYKLADMFLEGKGVPQSKKAAVRIVCEMHDENFKLLSDGIFECKYADIAFRLGSFHERGEGTKVDYMMAYYHYLQARFAIDTRIRECESYGDEKVKANIEAAIDRMLTKFPMDFLKEELKIKEPRLLGYMLSKSVGLDLELYSKNNQYYLKAKRLAADHTPKHLMVTIPELKFCQFVDEVELRLDGFSLENMDFDELDFVPQKAFINEIRFNKKNLQWEFVCSHQVLMTFGCSMFVFGEF